MNKKCIPRLAMNGITLAIFNKCINESQLLYCEFSNRHNYRKKATLQFDSEIRLNVLESVLIQYSPYVKRLKSHYHYSSPYWDLTNLFLM